MNLSDGTREEFEDCYLRMAVGRKGKGESVIILFPLRAI